jgi:osmotically inducible lipoprotein OsmB
VALFGAVTVIDEDSTMEAKRVAAGLCVVGVLAGCANMDSSQQRTLSGAAIGTAAGALIGELATGQPLHGAVLGAAAGAAGGWLYDRHEKSEGQ